MSETLRAERLVAGGDALARGTDGRVVFLSGALPGELVSAEVTEERKDFARARIRSVHEASDARREPPCPHRTEGCGGCPWMHIAPSAQLGFKVDIVREALQRTGRLADDDVAAALSPGGSVPADAYRTTIRLAAADTGRLGYRREASNDVVPISECLVAHPRLAEVAAGVTARPGTELTVRTSISTGATTAFWSGGGSVRGLPEFVRTGNTAWIEETIAGAVLRVSAASFFQSGPAAAELLVASVARVAGFAQDPPSGHVVDAYGGVGLFAATALASADEVTVVESSASACADARHNLDGRAATVVRQDVARWSPRDRPALVVADPARSGLGRRGVDSLVAAGPARLVLVSCDPVAFARDARLLADSGYRLRKAEVLDLFPQTAHVETVSLFGSDRGAVA